MQMQLALLISFLSFFLVPSLLVAIYERLLVIMDAQEGHPMVKPEADVAEGGYMSGLTSMQIFRRQLVREVG